MDQAVQLIPLVCMRCNARIPAGYEEVAWVCTQCGQGQQIIPGKGLAKLEVYYMAGLPPDLPGNPYWILDGTVSINTRESFGSAAKQFEEARQFWEVSRRFFIPAHATTLEDFLSQATGLLLSPPILKPGLAVQFSPVTVPVEDAQPAAEFIVMAIEANRKDRLRNIDFSLILGLPSLWILGSGEAA